MAVIGKVCGPTRHDPDLAVHCESCGWRSTIARAKSEMNDVVRCPECDRPVVVDNMEALSAEGPP